MQWSKIIRVLEPLWVPELSLRLHPCRYRVPGSRYSEGALQVFLNKEMIWNYPADFFGDKTIYGQPMVGYVHGNMASVVRAYMAVPRLELLTQDIPDDDWALGDILRAADRRIGDNALRIWALSLDDRLAANSPNGLRASHPAKKVLRARFASRQRIPVPQPLTHT